MKCHHGLQNIFDHEIQMHRLVGIDVQIVELDTNITSLEHNNMYTTHEGVSVRMNPSFTIMTNLDNFKKDMELVSQTSKDISSKLNEYGTKITDKLLVNELKLDDLKTIDQNIQL